MLTCNIYNRSMKMALTCCTNFCRFSAAAASLQMESTPLSCNMASASGSRTLMRASTPRPVRVTRDEWRKQLSAALCLTAAALMSPYRNNTTSFSRQGPCSKDHTTSYTAMNRHCSSSTRSWQAHDNGGAESNTCMKGTAYAALLQCHASAFVSHEKSIMCLQQLVLMLTMLIKNNLCCFGIGTADST